MSQAPLRVPPTAWLLLALLAALPGLWGCGRSEQSPLTAQSSRYEVGEERPSAAPPAAQPQGAAENAAPAASPAAGQSSAAGQAASAGQPPAAGRATPAGQPPAPPNFDPSAEVNPEQLPDDEAQLLGLLQMLQVRQPRGASDQEQYEDFLRLQHTRVKAAEKLMTVASSPETRRSAVQTKLDAMRGLTLARVPNMEKQLTAYCQSLQQGDDPESAFLGRLMLFGLAVDELAEGEPTDVDQILAELKSLAEDAKDNPGAFMVISQAAEILQRTGERQAAIEAYRTLGEAFGDSQDPNMAAQAAAMLERVRSLDAGLDSKLRAMLLGEADSEAPVMATINQLLESEGAGAGTLAEMTQVGQFLEMTDRYELARQLYQKIVESYQDHADTELAGSAVEQAQNGLKRVGLIGKPVEVHGATLDGSAFDWPAYKGKVVLVDFWATWCQPCLMEMPNIARAYREYQDRGFEVVGISLDDNTEAVQRFMEVQPLPWTILVGADENSQGIANPLAIEFGVDSLPFVLLVDREGKVVALHVRGPRLQQKLAELLGPAEGLPPGPAPQADPAQPAGQPAADQTAEPPVPAPPAPAPAAEPALEPPAESQSSRPHRRAEQFFVALHMLAAPAAAAQAVLGADAAEQPAADDVDLYAPQPGLSPAELVEFILAMQDKPQSIQQRPGFGNALVLASERILAAEPSESQRRFATQIKLEILHERACRGDEQADQALSRFVAELDGTADPKLAELVRFFQIERRVVEADALPLEEVPQLLAEVKASLADQKLQEQHLRLASGTVRAINRLEDAQQREQQFREFGELFAKSSSKELARYGRGLIGTPAAALPQLVGKPLELSGLTGLGTAFDWSSYRGKVVLVDFWASWCGPCRAAMPQLKTLHEQLRDQGFAVVGVSLDTDQAAMADYLEENEIHWTNLVGEDAAAVAKKYGIRALPTLLLVDRAGQIVAAGHKLDALKPQLDKLLQG